MYHGSIGAICTHSFYHFGKGIFSCRAFWFQKKRGERIPEIQEEKNSMKKAIAMLLVVLMVGSFAACSGTQQPAAAIVNALLYELDTTRGGTR